jgi:hypothetical protein
MGVELVCRQPFLAALFRSIIKKVINVDMKFNYGKFLNRILEHGSTLDF